MKVKGNLMKKTYQITEKGKGDLEVELADLKSRRGEIAEKIAVRDRHLLLRVICIPFSYCHPSANFNERRKLSHKWTRT